MSEFDDWNRSVIEEFRANHGKLGGAFAGGPMLLLRTKGAKTGQERVNPMMYLAEGDKLYVFASKGGAPTNPDWYHNLVAHPQVTVELGDETFPATATPVTGAERDRIYAEQSRRYPMFGEYQQKTRRTIPVIALERGDGPIP